MMQLVMICIGYDCCCTMYVDNGKKDRVVYRVVSEFLFSGKAIARHGVRTSSTGYPHTTMLRLTQSSLLLAT